MRAHTPNFIDEIWDDTDALQPMMKRGGTTRARARAGIMGGRGRHRNMARSSRGRGGARGHMSSNTAYDNSGNVIGSQMTINPSSRGAKEKMVLKGLVLDDGGGDEGGVAPLPEAADSDG